jgi:hypothetical protein
MALIGADIEIEARMKGVVLTVTAALLISSMPSAADTWVFKDVLRAGGHLRSMKGKLADARKCGAIGAAFSDAVLPYMQSCMLNYGWALDRVIADPPRYAQKQVSVPSYRED